MPNSTQPSGHEIRSTKTRSQLIEADIEVIGSVGYEGASTRALAKSANTTLSAIPCHFRGRRELYLAAAHMIAEYAASHFDESLAALEADHVSDKAIRLEQALTNLMHVVREDAEPHSWTTFVARSTYDNDETFAVIYERAIAPMLERVVRTVSEISGRSPHDEALRLRISAIVMAVVSFRFRRGIMLRAMAWREIRPGSTEQIEGMIRDLCRSVFLAVHRTQ